MNVVFGVLAALLAVGEAPSIPDVIRSVDSSYALWVSARASVDKDGELRPVLDSGPGHALTNGAVRELRERECQTLSSEPIGDYEAGSPFAGWPASSVEKTAAGALGVYEGAVVAVTPGFASGSPGVMARVKVTRVVKASPAIRTEDDLLVFHDYARFAAGPSFYCLGYRPIAVGDRVFVMVGHPPLDENSRVVFAPETMFIEHDGKVLGPPGFRDATGVGDSGLAGLVARAVNGVRAAQ